MFDMQGYIIYVVLYFVIWLEFISESYFYVPTINKVFNNNNKIQDSLDPFCNCGRHQLSTSFSTAQVTQIKEKLFLKKLVASNVLC